MNWASLTPKHSKGRILSQARRDFTICPYLTRTVLFGDFTVTAYPESSSCLTVEKIVAVG